MSGTRGVTSGTISNHPFNMRKVIEHAARRAKRIPQKLTAEDVVVAQDLIFSLTAQWVAAGFPLWTRQYQFLSVPIGGTDAACSQGTVEIIHSYWRVLMPYRGPATTNAGVDAGVLFGGQPNADVILSGGLFATDQNDVIQTDQFGVPILQGVGFPVSGVIVSFGSLTTINTLGVLLGTGFPVTSRATLLQSQDGLTWTVAADLPQTTFYPGIWNYVDVNPSPTSKFFQVAFGRVPGIAINQLQLGQPHGTEIQMGPLNMDDYYNLPDKLYQAGRPTSMFQDRQVDVPVLKIYPAMSQEGFYNGISTALTRSYIQDPGQLTNTVAVPQRWAEALTWRLAHLLMFELPDEMMSDGAGGQAAYTALMAKQQMFDRVEKEAAKAEGLAWSSEVNTAPIRWMPNLRPYTA